MGADPLPQLQNIEDAPFYDGMSVRDSVDFYALWAGLNQIGVLSGCLVTDNGGSDMHVVVAAGTVIGNYGTVSTVAQTTLLIGAASASDRRDTIIYTPGVGCHVDQ